MKKITFALFAVVVCFNTYANDENLANEVNELRKIVDKLECELKKIKELKLQQVDTLSLAKGYIDKKEYEEAVSILVDMYKSDPNGKDAPQVLYLLGLCFKNLNKPDKAKVIFEKIVKNYSSEEYGDDFINKAKNELNLYSKKSNKNQ